MCCCQSLAAAAGMESEMTLSVQSAAHLFLMMHIL